MLKINKVHHIAIIASDYQKSKAFYTEILGLEILSEVYREERDSYKLDLGLNGNYVIELFSFPNPPERLTQPEAAGLRHICFEVDDIQKSVEQLAAKNISYEPIRVDAVTGKSFTFIFDPDQLPVELYQS
ncbi:SMU1112c/YaeR family gloxylase I-like metalloprotein [Flexithrix dorotheae]|uniref:SMU1112c/YaeR family gloxylase I-like metalloprotein n=1 Tax=Flexithrix dorotheae TaxID=70993 RepID=UPI00036F04DD|nr:VOC family protein [Flexithrix dorotheae]